MSTALTYPTGYWPRSERDEYGDPCYTLVHEHFGDLSDHACHAEAICAAHDHADALADEASEADALVAEQACEDALDTFRALIAGHPITLDQGDAVARGERRAVRRMLNLIDSSSVALSFMPDAVAAAAHVNGGR